jgi:hypothetical protein
MGKNPERSEWIRKSQQAQSIKDAASEMTLHFLFYEM